MYISGGSEEPKPGEPTLGTPIPQVSNSTTTLATPPAGGQNSTDAPGTDGGINPGGDKSPQEATTTVTAAPTTTETPITGNEPITTTLSTTTTTRNATG